MTGKRWTTALFALSLLMIGGILPGCTERVKETLDPELEIVVEDIKALGTSPPPDVVNASEGKEFLYVRVNITNGNEKTGHTIWSAERFSVDDNSGTVRKGSHLANTEMRELDSLIIQPKEAKSFWVVFEVENDVTMIYLRYEPGIDEPMDIHLPVYSHFKGKV